jgi:hypothetical protein
MLFSGETGYQLSEEALRNKQATYDANRELLDFLSGAYQAIADREAERQFGLLQAQQEAALRQQEIMFRQQQMAQEMALAQQQMAAAAAGGGGAFDLEAFLNEILGGGMGGAAPMPSPQEVAAAKAVAKKAARHRTDDEKDLLRQFNALYGPVGQY